MMDAAHPFANGTDGIGRTDRTNSRDDFSILESHRQFSIEVIEGADRSQSWTSKGQNCTIGSHPSCDLILSDSAVSRFHCEIVADAGGIRIRDLSSSNGVYVDGVRVIEGFLRTGSTIRLGRSGLRFQHLIKRSPIKMSQSCHFGRLVGESSAMRHLFANLACVARKPAKVLLEGATGTGKSMAARAIHEESDRRDGPFVMVDCGAIPADLLESELLGHVKGAFTGATQDRPGAFETASGGTLFLDEIGELPLQLQPKLLTILDTGMVRRVGSNHPRPVDVRVITATNRDLRVEVNDGRFREDLYYRLAVVRIRMPELRQRPEDLPLLVRTLLSSLGAAPDIIESLMASDLMATVRRAAWPGNVRQLRNYLEQCLVYDDVVPTEANDSHHEAESALQIDPTLPWNEAKAAIVNQAARMYFGELLHMHKGNVAQAAEAAGVNRTYLYRLLNRHAIIH